MAQPHSGSATSGTRIRVSRYSRGGDGRARRGLAPGGGEGLSLADRPSRVVPGPPRTERGGKTTAIGQRPEQLAGSTYKIKTPLSEHALYVTINDVVLNPGTEHELRRPFEIFIDSRNMEHFQWIVALTRIISAVFRKGGDVAFLVEELHSVFDPGGGYLKRGGRHVPSLVAEIGTVIEEHLITIGLMKRDGPDERQQRHIDEVRRELGCEEGEFPPDAAVCARCSTKAAVMLDGCMTCLNCGDSKCG